MKLTCYRADVAYYLRRLTEATNRRSVGSAGLRIGLDFVGVKGECPPTLSPATVPLRV